jgi:hypothetical protein
MVGLGPVTLGMSVAEAEAALGGTLENPYDSGTDDEFCVYLRPTSADWPGVSYMVIEEAIARIDIYRDFETDSPSPFADEMGFGIGSAEADIIAAYGARLETGPHPYNDDLGKYLTLRSEDGSRTILFETDRGTVTTFRTGRYPEVGYVEGCS